uniref:Uncharacterized protein n=1 Tax=Arundo donax TaxID=35708 RepID=A0A0A8XUC3_ARUDO
MQGKLCEVQTSDRTESTRHQLIMIMSTSNYLCSQSYQANLSNNSHFPKKKCQMKH